MVREVRIVGNLAQSYEVTLLNEATLEEVMPILSAPTDLFMSGLPTGLHSIYHSGDQNRLQLIVQQTPNVRQIDYNGHNYRLSIPWTYWVFAATRQAPNRPLTLQNWLIFVTGSQLVTDTQKLYPMPLQNVYQDGRICFGSAAARPGSTLGQHIDELVSNFWNSEFNDDVNPMLPYNDYQSWQDATEDNPNAYTEWNWENGWGSPARDLRSLITDLPNRTDTVITNNNIPALDLGATWGRVREWYSDTLDDRGRELLRGVIQQP